MSWRTRFTASSRRPHNGQARRDTPTLPGRGSTRTTAHGLHPLTELPTPARSLESLIGDARLDRPAEGEGFLARYRASRRSEARAWVRPVAVLVVVGIGILLFFRPG